MDNTQILEMTSDIVKAYVGQNSVPAKEIGSVIETTYATINRLAKGEPLPAEVDTTAPIPATTKRKSLNEDFLICLDDGKKFKSLKRHLATLGMTPEQYRAKWELPHDYPMVAPSYAKKRSELAKNSGLGQIRKS